MSKYDGLIIPRSYSEYLNKTDGATLSQMLDSIGGTFDAAPTPNSVKPARSGGIFNANAIITADSKVLSGPAISARSIIRVFFTAAITGSDAATGLTLTYNGSTYAVKATANGALKDFTPYPIATETRELTKGKTEKKSETKGGTRATVTNYVFCQAYTTLEMMFDGTQFIIIGTPAVISNSDYTVYTDGSIAYTKQKVDNSFNTKYYVTTTEFTPINGWGFYLVSVSGAGYSNDYNALFLCYCSDVDIKICTPIYNNQNLVQFVVNGNKVIFRGTQEMRVSAIHIGTYW